MESQFGLACALNGGASFFFLDGGNFVEAALVTAAEECGGQEDLSHFDCGFAGAAVICPLEEIRGDCR